MSGAKDPPGLREVLQGCLAVFTHKEIRPPMQPGVQDRMCEQIKAALAKLSPASPNARPLWMGDAANRILELWPEWEAQAEQESQIEQNSDAGQFVMLGHIETAIAEEYAKQ